MATGYAYRPLRRQNSEIRVLEIISSNLAGHEHSMECSLRLVALDSESLDPFIAVSYCWGDSKSRANIEIDGQTVNISESAAVAVRKLCGAAGQRLWIDAICIYSHRTTMKDLRILRFAPQFFEEFNFTHLASWIWQYILLYL